MIRQVSSRKFQSKASLFASRSRQSFNLPLIIILLTLVLLLSWTFERLSDVTLPVSISSSNKVVGLVLENEKEKSEKTDFLLMEQEQVKGKERSLPLVLQEKETTESEPSKKQIQAEANVHSTKHIIKKLRERKKEILMAEIW